MSRLSTEFLLVAMICLPALCRADPVLEEITEQKYNASPTAKFSIRNTDGSIRLYGADITELKVQAVKKAYKPDRLKEISVNVSVQPDRISINTKFPSPPRWPWSDRSG